MNSETTKLKIIDAVLKIEDERRLGFFLKVIEQEHKMPHITRAFYDLMIQELSQVVQAADIQTEQTQEEIVSWQEKRAQLLNKA